VYSSGQLRFDWVDAEAELMVCREDLRLAIHWLQLPITLQIRLPHACSGIQLKDGDRLQLALQVKVKISR
jgi:hypothetical protein